MESIHLQNVYFGDYFSKQTPEWSIKNLIFIIGSVLVTLMDMQTSCKSSGLSHIDGDYCI